MTEFGPKLTGRQMTEEVFITFHYKEDEDDSKLIGVYSTRAKAEAAAERSKLLPGFKDRPDDFLVERYRLDQDHWTSGYVADPIED